MATNKLRSSGKNLRKDFYSWMLYDGFVCKILLTGILSVSLIGCGGSDRPDPESPDTGNPVPVEPTPTDPDPINPPSADPSIPPEPDGSSSLIASAMVLSVEEDSILSLRLNVISGEPARFALHRAAQFGEVEVQQDGEFTYTPEPHFHGDDSFEFYAWNEEGGTLPATVNIRVTPLGDAPVIVGNPALVVKQGEVYKTQFFAADVDAEALAFVSSDLPDWLELDQDTGELVGIPSQADVGLHEIVVSAVDSAGVFSYYPEFTIEVIDVNDPPRLDVSAFPATLDARQSIEIDLSPIDIDGDDVEIDVSQHDSLRIEVKGDEIELTASDVQQVTPLQIELTASDDRGAETVQLVSLNLLPLHDSGNTRTVFGKKDGPGIHIVVVGDGYQENEAALYATHVDDLITMMLGDPAVATHAVALNIHAVTSASTDSGIDDFYKTDSSDTKFDSGYFCRNIERLICADELKMLDTALEEVPYFNELILLANDRRFGGSGGNVAIASAYFPEIAIHEMGHLIANLADEYVDGTIDGATGFSLIEGQFANVSGLNDPGSVPWSHWIEDLNNYPTQPGESGVGIFEGAYYKTTELYRPTSTSRMRSNLEPFGPVNGEQWVLSLYREIGAVLDFSPVLRVVEIDSGNAIKFRVEPLFGETLQKVEWYFNDELIAQQTNENSWEFVPPVGEHVLEVRVSDISGLVRKPSNNPATFIWQWELMVQ